MRGGVVGRRAQRRQVRAEPATTTCDATVIAPASVMSGQLVARGEAAASASVAICMAAEAVVPVVALDRVGAVVERVHMAGPGEGAGSRAEPIAIVNSRHAVRSVARLRRPASVRW